MRNINEMTDEELAIAYIEGNNTAFDELLLRNQTKLFTYILFVVRNHDIADDVFQETFVKAIVKLQQHKYTANGKFSAWLMRIAHNIIMDIYRSGKSKKTVETKEDNDLSNIGSRDIRVESIERDYVNNQVFSDVRKMMNLLPPAQREVVYMRYYQNMSFKDIAKTTNVSINTSLGRMRYALLNLRRMTKEHKLSLELF